MANSRQRAAQRYRYNLKFKARRDAPSPAEQSRIDLARNAEIAAQEEE
tara:strand:+ start:182 stop:325 length:144 start_codon:yes stop_codon:yes gene_type:complete